MVWNGTHVIEQRDRVFATVVLDLQGGVIQADIVKPATSTVGTCVFVVLIPLQPCTQKL